MFAIEYHNRIWYWVIWQSNKVKSLNLYAYRGINKQRQFFQTPNCSDWRHRFLSPGSDSLHDRFSLVKRVLLVKNLHSFWIRMRFYFKFVCANTQQNLVKISRWISRMNRQSPMFIAWLNQRGLSSAVWWVSR